MTNKRREGWILLSKRKPVFGQHVLLWSVGWMRMAYWNDFMETDATHWMQLPEPPLPQGEKEPDA